MLLQQFQTHPEMTPEIYFGILAKQKRQTGFYSVAKQDSVITTFWTPGLVIDDDRE